MFTQGTPQIWPTCWAGGSKNWYPNRAFLKMVQPDGSEIITCFIEHHGTGHGDDIYPTQEDYANLRLYSAALQLQKYAEFEERMEQFIDEVNEVAGTVLRSEVFIWDALQRLLPEIAAECPPLTPEQLSEMPEYDATSSEDCANARSFYYGFLDGDGLFAQAIDRFGTQRRRAALALAAGKELQ